MKFNFILQEVNDIDYIVVSFCYARISESNRFLSCVFYLDSLESNVILTGDVFNVIHTLSSVINLLNPVFCLCLF